MKKIAILSQKGGAGKTTLAVHLAVAAELDGKSTAVIDLDPQASASAWADSRDDETPVVVSGQAARLKHMLEVAEEAGADLVIIDTAPHSENASLQAARAVDYILIPCRGAASVAVTKCNKQSAASKVPKKGGSFISSAYVFWRQLLPPH